MAAAANIVIADAQATPVNHTFVPIGFDQKDSSVFWFEDQSQASPIGYWRMSIQLKRPAPAKAGDSSGFRVNRVVIGMHLPVLETVSNSTVSGIVPAPTLSYIPRAIVELIIPERSTLQNRKDLRKMLALALADAQVVGAIESLTAIY